MQRVVIAVLVVLAVGLCYWEWSHRNHVPAQPKDSVQAAQVAPEPRSEWTLDVGKVSRFFGTFASNGTVYLTTGNTLFAVDSDTGTLKWKVTPREAIQSSPAESDGVVVVLTGKEQLSLVGFSAESGRELWAFQAQDGFFSDGYPMVISHSIAYFLDISGSLYAVSVPTGELKWQKVTSATDREWDAGVYPVVRDGMALWSDGRLLRAVDVSSGKEKWSKKVFIDAFGVVGGTAWYTAASAPMRCVNLKTGASAWSIPMPYAADITIGPDFGANALFRAWDNGLQAVNSSTGKALWADTSAGVEPTSSTIRTDNRTVCFVGSSLNETGGYRACALDAATGKLLWSRATTESASVLVVRDGYAVLLEDFKTLTVLEARTGKVVRVEKSAVEMSEQRPSFAKDRMFILRGSRLQALPLPGVKPSTGADDVGAPSSLL